MMNDEAKKKTGNIDFYYGRVGYDLLFIFIECKSIIYWFNRRRKCDFFYTNYWKRIILSR